MKVMKFGGGCLATTSDVLQAAHLAAGGGPGTVTVISALGGVTDRLECALHTALSGQSSSASSASILTSLLDRHRDIARQAIPAGDIQEEIFSALRERMENLGRLLEGVALTGEAGPTVRARILSIGERLSAILLAGVLRSQNVPAMAVEADQAGIIACGPSGSASADLEASRTHAAPLLRKLIDSGVHPIVTGFFGRSPEGKTALFGRNGSDYSAAIVACLLDARVLEIWKDVGAFASTDPRSYPGARPISRLSYGEAAELSYFGAQILHPRTVEPLASRGIPIHIRSMQDPHAPGTRIGPAWGVQPGEVRSVTMNPDVALLRIVGPGVGMEPGILGRIGQALASSEVNVLSALTSQTCINLLLDARDGTEGLEAIRPCREGAVEKIEVEEELALLALVGDGIRGRQGVLARATGCLSAQGINVEMTAMGASDSAAYFVIRRERAGDALAAAHREFFGC